MKEIRDQIDECLNTLDPKDKRVLELRFGLTGMKPMSFKAIAGVFAVTPERIRQRESRAIRKMRHPKRSRLLKDYLTDRTTELTNEQKLLKAIFGG